MCGRFASALKPSDAWLELMQEWSDELFERYNVSPTAQIGAFVEGQCHSSPCHALGTGAFLV